MSTTQVPIALFRIGRISTTPDALQTLSQPDILTGLQRHQAGDWGDVGNPDREANDQALRDGTRLFSVYHSANQVKFWIITEADRSRTTVLLPRDIPPAFVVLPEGISNARRRKTNWSSVLHGESTQTGSNLLEQVDDRKESNMEQPELFKFKPPKIRKRKEPQEYKIISLRDCPVPEKMHLCDTPQLAADYWRIHVTTTPHFDPERECFVVMMLNTRKRIKGHQFVSTGTMDTLLIHPREVFRTAITVAAAAIVLMHNHPSGDATPSEADIKVTRDLIRAGQLLKIDVVDHVIVGNQRHCSLRELGYFYS